MKREEAIEKALANGTISRKKSLRRSEAPAIALEVPKTDRLQAGNMASSHHQDADGPFSGMSGLMTTLKRSLSRRDPRGNEFNNLTDASPPALSSPVSEDEIQTFDPLVIPWDEEYLKTLRAYRLTESQSKMLHYIFSIYNGTHNWHNYIPGASPDDPRCYLRILNIEVSPAEMHNGLEWIRIKVQAKAFARLQVRKMVAFAVMVTRTNTPRSVVANSFGYAKFHVPEVPAQGLILDEPHYSDYNAYAAQLSRSVIDFEGINDSVEEFRRSNIHESLYTAEAKDMLFAKWIRNMDSYSFLYTHFLNTRGLILKNVAAA